MQKIVVMDHPLIQHKVGLIRKKRPALRSSGS